MSERPTPWEQLDGVKFVLEQILEQAVEWERSRIIKLLENSLIALPWEGIFWNEETMGKSHSVDVTDLIELIKGETNE